MSEPVDNTEEVEGIEVLRFFRLTLVNVNSEGSKSESASLLAMLVLFLGSLSSRLV